MVLSEAIVLAFVGAFSGLILGLAASFYFAEVGLDISGYLSEQGMGGTLIEPVLYGGYDPLGMAVFCGGMIVIAILASIYPTHRVLKVRPSEAMRVY
jgi:ABC-type lipoprotein release transport system permease subunit